LGGVRLKVQGKKGMGHLKEKVGVLEGEKGGEKGERIVSMGEGQVSKEGKGEGDWRKGREEVVWGKSALKNAFNI